MASPILTNKTIASTYKGVLHSNGAQLPLSGVQPIYDGIGQESALSVGLSGKGVTSKGNLTTTTDLKVERNAGIVGILSAGGYTYPTSDAGVDSVMVLEANNQLSLKQITRETLGITKERTFYTTSISLNPNSPLLYSGDIIENDVLWMFTPSLSGISFNYSASRISFSVSFHALYSANLHVTVRKYLGNSGGTWTADTANNFSYTQSI